MEDVVSSIEQPDRPTSAARRMVSATCVRGIGKAILEIAADGKVGGGDDGLGMGQSLIPGHGHIGAAQVKAWAAEEVASALAPSAAIMRADPTSHGLGMTKQPCWCRS